MAALRRCTGLTLSIAALIALVATVIFHGAQPSQMRKGGTGSMNDRPQRLPHRIARRTRIKQPVQRQTRTLRSVAHRLAPAASPQPPVLRQSPIEPHRVDPPQRLLAVAIGGRPQAIITIGNETRVVTIGDRVAGRKIEAIGFDGVLLSGRRRALRIHD